MIVNEYWFKHMPEDVQAYLRLPFEERMNRCFAERLSLWKRHNMAFPIKINWLFKGGKNDSIMPHVTNRVPMRVFINASEFGLTTSDYITDKYVYDNLTETQYGKAEKPNNVCQMTIKVQDAFEKDPTKRLFEVKTDIGYESNMAGAKGLMSDANKRTTAHYGVALQVYETAKVFVGGDTADFKKVFLFAISKVVEEYFEKGAISPDDVVKVFTEKDYFDLYIMEDKSVTLKKNMEHLGRFDKKGNELEYKEEEEPTPAQPTKPAPQAQPKPAPQAQPKPVVAQQTYTQDAGISWLNTPINNEVKALLDAKAAGEIKRFADFDVVTKTKAAESSRNTLGVWRCAAYESKHGSKYYLFVKKSSGEVGAYALDMDALDAFKANLTTMSYKNAQ